MRLPAPSTRRQLLTVPTGINVLTHRSQLPLPGHSWRELLLTEVPGDVVRVLPATRLKPNRVATSLRRLDFRQVTSLSIRILSHLRELSSPTRGQRTRLLLRLRS